MGETRLYIPEVGMYPRERLDCMYVTVYIPEVGMYL
jgi:hypothetical protein